MWPHHQWAREQQRSIARGPEPRSAPACPRPRPGLPATSRPNAAAQDANLDSPIRPTRTNAHTALCACTNRRATPDLAISIFRAREIHIPARAAWPTQRRPDAAIAWSHRVTQLWRQRVRRRCPRCRAEVGQSSPGSVNKRATCLVILAGNAALSGTPPLSAVWCRSPIRKLHAPTS